MCGAWSTLCFVYSSGICAWSLVFKSLSLVSIISYFYFRSCIYLSMTSCHIYAKEKMILCRNVSKKNLTWNFPLGVILLCMVWCYKFLLGIAIVVFTLTAFSLTKANYIDRSLILTCQMSLFINISCPDLCKLISFLVRVRARALTASILYEW